LYDQKELFFSREYSETKQDNRDITDTIERL
jgi:hypothetical protein